MEPVEGAVPPGESEEITVTLNTFRIEPGRHEAALHILTNEPDHRDIVVDISIDVAEEPDIAVNPDLHDFGEVWVGLSTETTIRIANEGNIDLTVSNIAAPGDGFETDFENEFVLEPNDFTFVTVTFAPPHNGEIEGTLIIASDDPDDEEIAVSLAGIGLDPPLMAVEPEAVEADRTGEYALTVSNDESSEVDLEWNTSFAYIVPEEQRDAMARDVRKAGARGPQRDELGEVIRSFSWNRAGRDIGKSGMGWDYDEEIMWMVAGYPDNAACVGAVDPNDNFNEVYYFRPNVNGYLDIAYLDGYLYLICRYGRYLNKYNRDGEYFGAVYGGEGVNIYGPTHGPSVSSDPLHGWLIISNNSLACIAKPNVNGTLDLVGNLNRNTQYMEWVPTHTGGELWAYHGSAVKQFDVDLDSWEVSEEVQEFEPYDRSGMYRSIAHDGENLWIGDMYQAQYTIVDDATVESYPWGSREPFEGILSPGESEEVIFTIDPRNLNPGAYEAELTFYSNGLENEEIVIPISLEFGENPEIAVSADEIVFDEIWAGSTRGRTMTITNNGISSLTVTDAAIEGEGFRCGFDEEITIERFESFNLAVVFEPQEAGEYEGTLIITSNDPQCEVSEIELRGTAIAPPALAAPEAFEGFGTSQRALTIGNDGDDVLEWRLVMELVGVNDNEMGPRRDDLGDELRSFTWGRAGAGALKPGLAWDRDQNLMWLSTSEYIGAVDPANNFNEAFSVQVEEAVYDLAWLDGILYGVSGGAILKFNERGGSLGELEIPDEFEPRMLAADQSCSLLFISPSSNQDVIYVYSVADGEIVERVGAIDNFRGLAGRAVCYNLEWVPEHPDGELWLHTHNHVWQIDVDTDNWRALELVQDFAPWNNGDHWDGIVHDGENIWLGSRNQAEYHIFDDATLERPVWITAIEPAAGEIEPGAAQEAVFTFDAADLVVGHYHADMHMRSNDPNNADFVIDVTFHVGTFPAIEADPMTIQYGRVEIGASEETAITIRNIGRQDLIISDVAADEQLETDFEGELTIGSFESQEMTVTYSPTQNGPYEGALTIASNDPNNGEITIAISGTGGIPAIELDPEAITSYNGGEYSFDINNAGTDDLVWSTELEIVQEAQQDRVARHRYVRRANARQNGGSDPAASFFTVDLNDEDPPLHRDDEAEWIEWGPAEGTIEPHGSQEIAVTLFGEEIELPLGDYEANIHIASNDPDNGQAVVNVMMHVIEPAIFTIPETIDFGDTYVEGSAEEELWIYNQGDQDIIVSNITVDGEYFNCDFENEFTITPQDSARSLLTFAPRALDEHEGVLTIFSNDLDRQELEVPLQGFCYGIPEIAVDPGAIESTNGGDFSVTLANNGNGYLEWDSEVEFAQNRDGAARTVRSAGPARDAARIPRIREFSSQTAINLPNEENINRDAEDRWVTWNPSEGVINPDETQEIEITLTMGDLEIGDYEAGLVLNSNDEDNARVVVDLLLMVRLPIMVVEPLELDFETVDLETENEMTFEIRNDGNVELTVSNIEFAGSEWFSTSFENEFTVASGAAEEITVTFAPDEEGDFEGTVTIASDDPRNETEVVNIAGRCRGHADIVVDPMEIDSENGGEYAIEIKNEGNIDLNWDTDLELLAGEAGWIEYEPQRGTISRGDSAEVNLTLSIAEMSAGDYEANLHFESNDEQNPDVVVNIVMHCNRSWIAVEPPALDFAEVNIDRSRDLTFNVGNQGNVNLVVSEVALEGRFFSMEPNEAFTLEPDQNSDFTVTFAPEEVGDYAGSITLTTNDPDRAEVVIALNAIAVNQPLIGVEPLEIETGESSDHTLTVSNSGGQTLEWETGVEYFDNDGGPEWVTPEPAQGSVEPGESGELTVSINIDGLEAGDHEADLHFLSNDPFHEVVVVDIAVHVDPPIIVVDPLEIETDQSGEHSVAISNEGDFDLNWTAELEILAEPGRDQNRRIVRSAGGDDFLRDDEADWIGFAPAEGVVAPGETGEMTITLDAAGLDGGDYEAGVHILSDDPENADLAVNVRLHVAENPIIACEPEAVDFGEVVVGQTGEETLTITNDGNSDLIISEVTVDGEGFDSNFENEITIARQQSAGLTVYFAPPDDGEWEGEVTIVSNDNNNGEITVSLTGVGLDPPTIAFDPENIETDQGGDYTVTVSNIGDLDLEWTSELEIVAEPGRDKGRRNIRSARRGIPQRDDPGEIIDRFSWNRLGSNRYKAGIAWDSDHRWMWLANYNPNIIGAVDPANDYREVRYSGIDYQAMDAGWMNGVLYVTPIWNRYAARFDADCRDLGRLNLPTEPTAMTCSRENNWLITLSDDDQYVRAYTVSGNSVQQRWVLNIRQGALGNASIRNFLWVDEHTDGHLWISANDYIYQVAPNLGTNSFEVVQHFRVDGRRDWDGIGHDGENLWLGGYNQSHYLIVDDNIAEGCNWLSIDPAAGTVAPHESAEATLTFNAEELEDGVYQADVHFESNDPENADVIVEVTLNLGQYPAIALDAEILEFGGVDLGETGRQTLTISNEGEADLTVSNIVVEGDGFASDFEGEFVVAPGESSELTVTFTPEEVRDFEGTLTITSDDPNFGDVAVVLTGTGLGRAVIAVEPESIESDNGGEYTVTVSNSGSIDLEWTAELEIIEPERDGPLRQTRQATPQNNANNTAWLFQSLGGNGLDRDDEADWIAFDPADGVVEPNGFDEIGVTLSIEDLEIGDYEANLHILSNDPENEDIAVNVMLHVLLPAIAVEPENLEFGEVDLGQSEELTLTISNEGNANLTVSGIDVEGDWFGLDFEEEFVITPNESADVIVNFAPEETGDFEGTLTIASDSPGNGEITVNLSGTCVRMVHFEYEVTDIFHRLQLDVIELDGEPLEEGDEIGVFTPDGVCAGGVVLEEQDGLQPADINDLFPVEILAYGAEGDIDGFEEGDEFSFRVYCALRGGENEALVVFEDGPPAWEENGSSRARVNAQREPAPEIDVVEDDLEHDFGDVAVQNDSEWTFRINNLGGAELTIISVDSDNDAFVTDFDEEMVLESEQSLTVAVTFTPTDSTDYDGLLTVRSNDADEGEIEIPVTGTGIAPQISVAPEALSFGEVDVWESDDLSLTIRNEGNAGYCRRS